jgi:glucose 1-dehydrogenase
MGRLADPAEIADLVVWLASAQAGYVTATTYFLDGGIMQSSPGL